jgi:hypothetical protein
MEAKCGHYDFLSCSKGEKSKNSIYQASYFFYDRFWPTFAMDAVA